VNGYSIIKYFYEATIFDRTERFYELDFLEADLLLGFKFMKKAKMDLNCDKGVVICGNRCEKILNFDEMFDNDSYENLNCENNKDIEVINNISEEGNIDFLRNNIINEIKQLHPNINMKLPFRTDIRAEIRTITETPVWSGQYGYPMSVNSFVNEEVQKYLDDGIIRPSKSPYNSPVWVVSKKGTHEDGSPKFRLVHDYKKLNNITVSLKYPIPDCNVILSNLGKAKYFSTIDLESGFHQILMKEEDIEKTAFSVNNGKYEFIRMPFGLKNGPGIFQGAMDNILRKYVGKFCHVYIDDIIVFSSSLNEHTSHLLAIVKTLKEANMKISLEKSQFYKKEVEFLGYIVGHQVIKTDPKKIQAIQEYPVPTTLRQLRSFLGMAGYYRKFIKNYAFITKPLTIYLSGENGRVSQNKSKNTEIFLNSDAIEAFDKVKALLVDQVELAQPDFNSKFILTTDASNVAVGGVLSQNGKPITFISKTLSATERTYATNEKELYAIVWALKTLRNYLYGVTNLEIHTDHQPLTFAMSPNNPNTKMKRWHAFIEEFAPKIIYKPGTQNVVADALSRQFLNNITDDESLHSTQHSIESSDGFDIPRSSKPLNEFKQQILLTKSGTVAHESVICFGRTRHIIEFDTRENLKKILFEHLKPNLVTGVSCTAEDLYEFKETVKNNFTTKFLFTQIIAIDVTNEDDQRAIVEQTHVRAHRNYKENYKQIFEQYYWPKMISHFKEYIRHCEVCNKAKYNRHPQKIQIGEAPIPNKEGEYLNIDIFYAQSLKFITCVDAYSKFLVVKHIEEKTNLGDKVLEVLQSFPNAKKLTLDNEPGFTTPQFKTLMQRLNLELFYCTPRHSTTNGQIERAHSTLTEIARCIKEEFHLIDDKEAFYRAAQQYNHTIHSVTQKKPFDVFFNKIPHNLSDVLKRAQEKMLQRNRPSNVKTYSPGDVIYEKIIGQRNKLLPRYKKQTVQEDLGNKVKIISRNRIIHKNNIKT